MLAASLAGALPTVALALPLRIAVPDVRGDQLLFFFDGRADRVFFLAVANPASEAVDVELAVYGEDLALLGALEPIPLPPGGSYVVDRQRLAAADGERGLVVVTPIAPGGRTPIVPPEPLTGTFTLAHLDGAAFGENALGRLAVQRSDGERPIAGRTVDGTSVVYQQVVPRALAIPKYFAPDTLAPPEQDGNRLVLVAFRDEYGASEFRVSKLELEADVRACDDGGVLRVDRREQVDGLAVRSLQELGISSAPGGSAYVRVPQTPLADGNLFGIFSQTLGTFGAGHRLAAIDAVPDCSLPEPTPEPALCNDGTLQDGEECDGELRRSGFATCRQVVGNAAPGGPECSGTVTCGSDCRLVLDCCCPCEPGGPPACRTGAGFSCREDGFCGRAEEVVCQSPAERGAP